MYDAPHQFEPLLPAAEQLEPLLVNAHDLARVATQPTGQPVAPEMRALLRGMNSYYTNRIEGRHTRPHEIEQALRKDFSDNLKPTSKSISLRLPIGLLDALRWRRIGATCHISR